ncbi:MAG TPA: hypothetical protein DD413_00345 [Ruminococcus sp.]|nr:hypothetical protein [Ruminococcus sp.]
MSYGFEQLVDEARRLLQARRIEGVKALQKLDEYLYNKYLRDFPSISAMAINMNSDIYVLSMISLVQNTGLQNSDYDTLTKNLDEMMKKIYEILSPSSWLIKSEKSYMGVAPVYVGMRSGKNFGKLVLNKCYFYSNKNRVDTNAEGAMLLRTGWVVGGFVGSCKQHFLIPEKYDDLPIIGILPSAYTCIDEYRDEDAQHEANDYKYTMKVSVIFSTSEMRVIFPPRRFNNRYTVCVDYHTYDSYFNKVLDGSDGSRLSSVGMYDAAIMSFDPLNKNRNDILQNLINKAGSKNRAYVFVDFYRVIGSKYVRDSSSRSGDRKITWDKYFSLTGSSLQTCKECSGSSGVPYGFTDSFNQNTFVEESTKNSFEALGVGKYLYTTKSLNSSSAFKEENAVVGFVYRELKKPSRLYFNTINDTDVIINVEDHEFK